MRSWGEGEPSRAGALRRRGRDTAAPVSSPPPSSLSLGKTPCEGHLEARKRSPPHFDPGPPASRAVSKTSLLLTSPVGGGPPRGRASGLKPGRLRDQTTSGNTETSSEGRESSAGTPPRAGRTDKPTCACLLSQTWPRLPTRPSPSPAFPDHLNATGSKTFLISAPCSVSLSLPQPSPAPRQTFLHLCFKVTP